MEFKEKGKTFREKADGRTSFEPDGEEHDLDALLGEDYVHTSEVKRHAITETEEKGGD
jgi:hypothetical protein